MPVGSDDRGVSWTTWRVAEPSQGGALFFPYLSGGFEVAPTSAPSGALALSWFERSATDLRARVARLDLEDARRTVGDLLNHNLAF